MLGDCDRITSNVAIHVAAGKKFTRQNSCDSQGLFGQTLNATGMRATELQMRDDV